MAFASVAIVSYPFVIVAVGLLDDLASVHSDVRDQNCSAGNPDALEGDSNRVAVLVAVHHLAALGTESKKAKRKLPAVDKGICCYV